MNEERLDSRGSLRERFPWVGLADIDQPDLSSRYREIMAESRRDHEAIEAIDRIRYSA